MKVKFETFLLFWQSIWFFQEMFCSILKGRISTLGQFGNRKIIDSTGSLVAKRRFSQWILLFQMLNWIIFYSVLCHHNSIPNLSTLSPQFHTRKMCHHNSIPNLCTLSPQFHTKKGVTTLPYPIYVLRHHNSIPKRCVTTILYPIYVLCLHNSIPNWCTFSP